MRRAILTVAMAVFAQAAASMSSSAAAAEANHFKRAPQMTELDRFLGKWDCKGTVYPFQDAAEHPTHNLFTYENRLDGAWIWMEGNELPTADNPNPTSFMKGLQIFGFDRNSEKFVIFGVDASGAWWVQRSAMPVNNRFVFEKERPTKSISGHVVNSRDIYEFTGAGRLHHRGEVTLDGGPWKPVIDQNCVRQP